MNRTMKLAKQAPPPRTQTEIGFDVAHDRVGWRLTTYVEEKGGAIGEFLQIVENVPLTVAEAVTRFPHLREWITTETQQHLETLSDLYADDAERLRAELVAVGGE